MNKDEFKNMVEKYKKDLMKMAGIEVKAAETVGDEIERSNSVGENGNKTNEYNNTSGIGQGNPESFWDGAPFTGSASVDNSENNTYEDFMAKNKEYGYLKVQAFAAQQALPVSGVKIIVSKDFTDMKKIFFEGTTDESGIIDNIKLPAPAKGLSEHPSEILPYANYDFYSSYEYYKTESAPSVQIFEGIKTIQPVRVTL